jgi:hypothetical protein
MDIEPVEDWLPEARVALYAQRQAQADLRHRLAELLLQGTLTKLGSQVIIDFDEPYPANQLFDLLSTVPGAIENVTADFQ